MSLREQRRHRGEAEQHRQMSSEKRRLQQLQMQSAEQMREAKNVLGTVGPHATYATSMQLDTFSIFQFLLGQLLLIDFGNHWMTLDRPTCNF